ncbi:MAG: hypothetical protein EP349_02795 [Alphaproteobacteria bacterium]|nr:MAG: hypothetical protein EP349_02795 [Alphaproteobacteria bacterium]
MAIYINGKRVDGNGGGKSPKKETKIIDEIAAGEVFTHDGPVEVTGNIGAGATVKIENGGLHVKGDVEDGANLKVEDSGNGNVSISGGDIVGGNIRISGNFSSVSIGNISGGGSDENNLTVDGTTGNDVVLYSGHKIDIKAAGNGLKAEAGHSFKAQSIGDNAEVESGHSLTAGDVGTDAELDAGHSMSIGRLGDNSYAVSGHSFNGSSIGKACKVRAGHSLNVAEAHESALFKAGHSKNIGRIIGDEPEVKPAAPQQNNTPQIRHIDRRNKKDP